VLEQRNTRNAANETPELGAKKPFQTRASESVDLVVHSKAMREAYQLAQGVATSDIPVLIQGETGAGKGAIVEYIRSCRSSQNSPFLWVNCGGVPAQLVESTFFGHERGSFTGAAERSKGLFEAAHGGTLVLDEIGELCPAAQAVLLRVLDTQRFSRVGSTRELHVDVRILAATHRDLEQMCERNEFRRDLLYRLNACVISVPPLRERPEDIEPLAFHFLRRLERAGECHVTEIDAPALRMMKDHSWPGNVRELYNAIRRGASVARGHRLTISDLPSSVQDGGRREAVQGPWPSQQSAEPAGQEETRWDLRARLKELEADLIRAALDKADGNKTECARLLQIPYRTCVRKIKLLRI
jgi:DNA-binding NtrC family response regulator